MKKRELENKELKERMAIANKVRDSFEGEFVQAVLDIDLRNEELFATKTEMESEASELLKALRSSNIEVTGKIDKLMLINHKVETKNIRHVIVQFADDLRNGLRRSDTSYRNVMEYYDYYKNNLHENSYIDSEIEYIQKAMRENKEVV